MLSVQTRQSMWFVSEAPVWRRFLTALMRALSVAVA
jgi:hypothetical protein